MSYNTSSVEKELEIINIPDLEREFEKSMAAAAHEKEADFIVGGAGAEHTLHHNISDFDNWEIVPSVIHGLDESKGNTTSEILGIKLKTPIIVSPSAAHGLVHSSAESGTLKGTFNAGSLMTISTFSNQLLKTIHGSTPAAPWFYQFSFDQNQHLNDFLLNEAVQQGAKAIVVGVFGASFGRRERDIRNHFDFDPDLPFRQLAAFPEYPTGLDILKVNNRKRDINPDEIAKIKKQTGLPVLIKGIQSGEDAIRAIENGADGIWISNTGGRQLDGIRSTIKALPEIAEAVNKRVPIIFDSGIRRGQQVFKALALGADLVAIGRAPLYGLHFGGSKGVTSVLEQLRTELLNTMLLAGVTNIKKLKNNTRLEYAYPGI
ncbi:alpha-hydroxy-acid oxidizing protein [Liquorilactobacillus mali]|uniref:L-lactate oxidase n=1 Tax=Liquorilactobacillus mali KCTC 3596 = DSM 20444 TaxID=1046596 RepID=J0UTM6_9LACO|nr:alpha-hydroxy-acid oxidizing protein [Liquorilactobacillus mali]EJF00781.1 L-lactate oxidase [Liquorilactobacillus mali KCTC 3596 = DSM 20444]KRN11585.1 L-lactate oxidase [Liquorilactobacillus mali KCTC 3596 = DSM 20444]QFQ74332.1 lactate oxidase [Liquorilactobacillus mali]